MSGRPDFFKNKAASVGPTLPVFPGSTFINKHIKENEICLILKQYEKIVKMQLNEMQQKMPLPVCKSSHIQGFRLTAKKKRKTGDTLRLNSFK